MAAHSLIADKRVAKSSLSSLPLFSLFHLTQPHVANSRHPAGALNGLLSVKKRRDGSCWNLSKTRDEEELMRVLEVGALRLYPRRACVSLRSLDVSQTLWRRARECELPLKALRVAPQWRRGVLFCDSLEDVGGLESLGNQSRRADQWGVRSAQVSMWPKEMVDENLRRGKFARSVTRWFTHSGWKGVVAPCGPRELHKAHDRNERHGWHDGERRPLFQGMCCRA